jgi:hypothetical protein
VFRRKCPPSGLAAAGSSDSGNRLKTYVRFRCCSNLWSLRGACFPARVRRAGGVRTSKPIRFRCSRRWWSLVTSGTLAAAPSAANFWSSGSSMKAESWGSTRRVNSPSGRKTSATYANGGVEFGANKLGLAPGGFVPNQLKTFFPDGLARLDGNAAPFNRPRPRSLGGGGLRAAPAARGGSPARSASSAGNRRYRRPSQLAGSPRH